MKTNPLPGYLFLPSTADALAQERAALDAATANRNNGYAGVRAGQVDTMRPRDRQGKVAVSLLKTAAQPHLHTSRAGDYRHAHSPADRPPRRSEAPRDVAEAQANHDDAVRRTPTKEEDERLQTLRAGPRSLRFCGACSNEHLRKNRMRSPSTASSAWSSPRSANGKKTLHPVSPCSSSQRKASRLSFSTRARNFLADLTGRETVQVEQPAPTDNTGRSHELRPLGTFATWQASAQFERTIASTLRLAASRSPKRLCCV